MSGQSLSGQNFSGPPKEPFRIEQLWVDTRYRSTFIQIIALFIFMLFIAWLINNTRINLAALDKDLSFKFLGEPASYDINQRLIEYTSRSPHWKAAVVGILNTLLIAFMGCIAATLIGVIAGVLRLSKNWVVAKLMAVYIEGTRNVPLLLQILMWYTIFINVFPTPKKADPQLWGALIPTNRGVYVPGLNTHDGAWLVGLTLVLSIIAIFVFRIWAKRRQEATGSRPPVFLISLGLLILPALIMFFLSGMPLSLDMPVLKGFNYKGGVFMRASLLALWFALSLYTGAFIAENVRAGIMAVSKGQSEAAGALGLRSNRIMNLVVLPQALRVIIPPLISQYLNLTKNSSLAIAVGYMDATGTLGGITLNQTGREMECLLLLMAFYLAVSLTISFVMNIYNNRMKLQER